LLEKPTADRLKNHLTYLAKRFARNCEPNGSDASSKARKSE